MKRPQRADTINWIKGQVLIGPTDQLTAKEGSIFNRSTKIVDFWNFAKKSAAYGDIAIYNMMHGLSSHYNTPDLPQHINCRSTMTPIVGEQVDKFVMVSTCVVCNRVFNIDKLDKENCCPGCAAGSWKGEA